MPLPIPDILQNASAVIEAAKKAIHDGGDKFESAALADALKKVSSDDLLAVLNEVGKVYVALHNMRIQSVGSRANIEHKLFEVAFQVDFGLGLRTIIVPMPISAAEQLVKTFGEDLAKLTGSSSGKLITSIS